MKRLLIFGYGFAARALVRRLGGDWLVVATSRRGASGDGLSARRPEIIDPADRGALATAVAVADAILVAAPPGEQGCPGLQTLRPHLDGRSAPLLAYLSTTGVYGDRVGGWVHERTACAPISPEGHRRVQAEQDWRSVSSAIGSPSFIFRLPAIYGPGRSPLDRVRAGDARRWVKPGQVFSRIHVDDLADALARALAWPERAGVYNLCDDEPAAPADVTGYATRLLRRPCPPEEPLDAAALSPMARRFWAESKRVSNARAKAALGWRPAYPTYREGLRAVLAAEGGSAEDGDPHFAR